MTAAHRLHASARTLLAVLVLFAGADVRAGTPPAEAGAPATIFRAVQFDLPSKIVGRSFRIYVYTPLAPPPAAGYPVVVQLDGNLQFPIAATAALLTESSGSRPAIIVGVGYPTVDPVLGTRLRNRDLSPPTDLATVTHYPGQPEPKADDYGGADDFYGFLAEELRPALAARYPIDAHDQTIYGQSFAGLFALDVLFRHTDAFQTYLIASPAIYWNRHSVLAGEAAFFDRVRARTAAPRIFFTVGGDEQKVPDPIPMGLTRQAAEAILAESRTVDYTRELATRLSAVSGAPGYAVKLRVFEGENHLTVMFPSIISSLEFALAP